MSWGARFDDPIALANGRKVLTLQDAAIHITNLPWRYPKNVSEHLTGRFSTSAE